IGILQRNSISGDAVTIEVTLANWALKPVEFEASFEVDCDFYDSFEARGVKRLRRGEIMEPESAADCVHLSYLGLDNVKRTTTIKVTPNMERFENRQIFLPIKLDVNQRTIVRLDLTLKESAPEGVSLQPE